MAGHGRRWVPDGFCGQIYNIFAGVTIAKLSNRTLILFDFTTSYKDVVEIPFEELIDFKMLCSRLQKQGVSVITKSQFLEWKSADLGGLANVGATAYPYGNFEDADAVAFLKGSTKIVDTKFPGNGEPILSFTVMRNDYHYILLNVLNPHRSVQPILQKFIEELNKDEKSYVCLHERIGDDFKWYNSWMGVKFYLTRELIIERISTYLKSGNASHWPTTLYIAGELADDIEGIKKYEAIFPTVHSKASLFGSLSESELETLSRLLETDQPVFLINNSNNLNYSRIK